MNISSVIKKLASVCSDLSDEEARHTPEMADFIGSVNLDDLKVECCDPKLTLAKLVSDGDKLADECKAKGDTIATLLAALELVLSHHPHITGGDWEMIHAAIAAATSRLRGQNWTRQTSLRRNSARIYAQK